MLKSIFSNDSSGVKVSFPAYSKKKTAQKAVRDAAYAAGTAGVVATIAAFATPEIATKIADSLNLAAPWNTIVPIFLASLFVGVNKAVSDWSHRAGPENSFREGRK